MPAPLPRHQTVADYLSDRLARGEIVERSALTMRSLLNQWHRYAGPIQTWTDDKATAWVHDQTIRPNSRKNRLGKLRPYVRWLAHSGALDHDITADISPVHVPRPNPRDLPPAEVGLILAASNSDRTTLILLLMVHCALRSVDVARIRIEDIDPRRRVLSVRAKGGRGEVTHHVPIPAEAWTALADTLRSSGRSSGPLICADRRRTPTPLSPERVADIAHTAVRAAGLKQFAFDGVSPHALRHTCAQDMLDDGADIRQVQHALGHRHVTTTEIYLRRQAAGLAAAMDGRHYLPAA